MHLAEDRAIGAEAQVGDIYSRECQAAHILQEKFENCPLRN
jgi:hypothetical protein